MDVFIRFAFSLCLRNIYCHLIESPFSIAIINLYFEHAAHYAEVHMLHMHYADTCCMEKHAKHMLHCPRISNMYPDATCIYIDAYKATSAAAFPIYAAYMYIFFIYCVCPQATCGCYIFS